MVTLKLRLYRGKELSYNKNGQIKNENQTMKISDGLEWLNYLRYIKAQGLCKVDLLSVTKDEVSVSDISLWEKQLREACADQVEVEVIKETIKLGNVEFNAEELTEGSSKTADELKKEFRESLKKRAEGLTYQKNISNEKLEELCIKNGR